MKRIAAIITAIALVVTGIHFTPKQVDASVVSSNGSSSWSLVWSDEFNQTSGSTVNSNYWQFDIGDGGWGNNELQYYTNSTDNVRVLDTAGAVDGKALAITAKRNNGRITSGRIKSLDKQYVKYGKIEARIKMSNGMQPGVWPAFWMMGNDINSNGWPNCGEIDIMEHRNSEAQVISSLHWNPNANGSYATAFYGSELNGQYGYISSIDDWHTYAVEWYEDCMKFYLDGNWYETIALTSEMAEEFHKPHFILLNLAIGSTASEFTKHTTVTDSWSESTLYVDYVRLYQGTDSNFYRAQSSDTGSIVTTASPTAGMTACNGSGEWTSVGVWDYNIGTSWSGASAYYAGGTQNDFSIYMSSASTQEWGAMIRANQSVTAGHTYNYTINYTSTAAGSVLSKEDISSTGEQTVSINEGSGTITGSFTAGDSQTAAQILIDLRGISSGTKLSITGLSLTDTTSSVATTAAPTTTAPTTTIAPETTTSSTNTEWTVVDASNNVYFYGNANNMSVLNVQQPGFAKESGIYITTSEGIGYVTINGNKVGEESVAVQGAGAVVYLSALTSAVSTVAYYSSNGTMLGSINIKNANASGTEIETTTVAEETTTGSTTNPGQPGSSELAAPTGVSAYNFYAQEKGYRVDFGAVEGATAYKIYVDSSSQAVATVSASGEYISASALSAYADDALHSLYVAAVDSSSNVSVKSEAARVRITRLTNSTSDATDISRIYVVTNEGTKGGSNIIKDEKTPASLTIIGTGGVVQTASDGGTIKLRGNSTSLADKPAYNISFNSKKEVLSGSEKAKKWCLLANAYDKSMMRSKLAMDFGNALGSVASPDQQYADLYIDGVYKGTFLISEPAENGRAGIKYDDSDTSNEMMFEYEADEARKEEGQTYYTTGLGMRFVVEDPEGLDTSTDRYSKWVSTLATFENALKNVATSDNVLNYINVDSFVDMYIVNELFNTVDFGYSSVKFYIKNDADGNPIIYGGPLWDFDLSSGNSSVEEARQYNKFRCQEVNLWFNYLMKNTTFKNKVIAKFKSAQNIIQNIYKDNSLGTNQIDRIYEEIKASRIRNYTPASAGGAGWDETAVDSAEITWYPYSYGTVSPYNTYTYDQHVAYLRTWLQNRNEWMCTQWGIDYTSTGDEVVISSDIAITGYQMTASLNNIEGNMGFRVVYQAEPTVEGQTVTEQGLVYGLVYGNNPIQKSDVLYGAESKYVKSFVATDAGKLSVVMGDSQTASYYVMTMNCGSEDANAGITTSAYTTSYYVRAYAKLSDGTIAYSDVKTFKIFDVADYIYQNQLVSKKSTYDYLYSKILFYVDPTYKEGDFDWGNVIIK